MKTIAQIVQERRDNKEQKKLFKPLLPQKPDHSWLNKIESIFADFWRLISNKVWTVKLQDSIEVKVPKTVVEVKIPDVKVDIPPIEMPKQEVVVKVPQSSIKVNVPDVIVPPIKVPETKVVVEFKEPQKPQEISCEYDDKGTLTTITEKYKNGTIKASRKYNKWTINDKRNS